MNELSLYILDLTENSIHANSKNVTLKIYESKKEDLLSITIIDDGKGMSEETIKKAYDPFFTTRTTRKVGLGIPLFKELCELCEGSFKIDSTVGVGTKVYATFKLSSIDLPPLGGIVETLYTLICNEEHVDIEYIHEKDGNVFQFNTHEIKEVLDGVELSEPMVMTWFKDYVTNGLKEIKVI